MGETPKRANLHLRINTDLMKLLEAEADNRVVSVNLLVTKAIYDFLVRLVPVDEILRERQFNKPMKEGQNEEECTCDLDWRGARDCPVHQLRTTEGQPDPTRFQAYLRGGVDGQNTGNPGVHVDISESRDGASAEVPAGERGDATGRVDQSG